MRKGIVFLSAMILWLAPIPARAMAADDLGRYSWSGTWSTSWGDMILTQSGNRVTGTYTHDSGRIEGTASGSTLSGTWSEAPSYMPANDAGDIRFEMSADGRSFTGEWRYGSSGGWRKWDGSTRATAVESAPPSSAQPAAPTQASGSTPWSNASSWAAPELQKALGMKLIPDSLSGKDFTKPITRAEFAAVSVKLYENLSGQAAQAPAENPFADTRDPEVLKAYNTGITAGTSTNVFSPDALLTREQAAAMLTRVYKRVSIPGWTLATDASYPLQYARQAPFTDDAKISDWARDSVYFMASNSIISGTGNGNFSPRATTAAEEASSYANATREQALAIAARVVDNLKGVAPVVGQPESPSPQAENAYGIDDEEVPSIQASAGTRPIVGSEAGIEGGKPYVMVTYSSSSVEDDLIAYTTALVQDGWVITNTEQTSASTGKIGYATESKHAGELLIVVVEFSASQYEVLAFRANAALRRYIDEEGAPMGEITETDEITATTAPQPVQPAQPTQPAQQQPSEPTPPPQGSGSHGEQPSPPPPPRNQ